MLVAALISKSFLNSYDLFRLSSTTSSYSGPVCCSGLEADTNLCCWWEGDSDLELCDRWLLMQWYTRTPARNPTRSETIPVTTAVIPTAAPMLKDCTTSAVREKNSTLIHNEFHNTGLYMLRMSCLSLVPRPPLLLLFGLHSE